MVPKTAFGSAQAESFEVWSEDAEYLHLPRFYGLQNYGPAMFDDRVGGDSIIAKSNTTTHTCGLAAGADGERF